MKNTKFLLTTILTSIFITSCGGGGGGGGGESPPSAPPSTPSPTTSISADPTSVYVGNSTTLTWTSTDSTSCTASGDWEGSKSSSGNEDVQITKEGQSTFTITCSNSSGSSSSSAEVTGENLYAYADWDSHSLVIDNIQTRHQPYDTKINIEESWYKTLSIPESDFTTTVDTYSFEELQSGGIGYGSHLALSDRTYVFHSNWEGFNMPANGRAAALIYDNDRNLIDFVYKKIPGGTHQYPLINSDGTFQVLFPGVDEGELKDGEPGDATSWVFNPSDDTFSEIPINVGCHGSNKFDYEQDGDDDVICQSWGGEFDGKPIIFKNNGLLSFEAVRVETNGVPGHMSASAFYDDDFLNIIYTDTDGVGLSYNIADFTNVIARYLPNDLTKIVDVIELPKAFFERDVYKDIPTFSGWENSVGLSHDVRSHPIDYDNDGDIDIIIGSMIWANQHEYGFSVMQFLTNKDGIYVDETEQRLFNWSLFSPGTHSMHFYDFNGDGYTDIYAEDAGCNFYAAAGEPSIPDDYLCNGRLAVNDGTGHFIVVIETNQLNQLDYIRENFPRWAPFPGFSPLLGMTVDKELFWSKIRHDYDEPAVSGGDVVYNGNVDVVTVKLSKMLSTGPNGIDPALRGEPGYNEFYYLLNNESAMDSVKAGEYPNGLEHYIAVGKGLGYLSNAGSSNAQTETIEVSIEANSNGSGNVYVIDGVQKKSLTLNVGTTYTFNHSSAHPLRFSSVDDGTHGGGNEYMNEVTKSSGVTTIKITADTPTTLYYYCNVHSGMGADITVN
jgi:plastocyanin